MQPFAVFDYCWTRRGPSTHPRLVNVALTALSVVALTGAGQAIAQSGQAMARGGLTGTYQYSVQTTCLEDTEGFDVVTLQPKPLPTPLTEDNNGVHFIRLTYRVNSGTQQYNSNGTGIARDKASTFHTPNGTNGATYFESEGSCPFTYVVNRDESVDISRSCNFQDTVGSRASGTVTGIHTVEQLTQGRQLILGSSQHPLAVETVTVNPNSNSGSEGFTYYRICTRAGSLSRLTPGEKDR